MNDTVSDLACFVIAKWIEIKHDSMNCKEEIEL